MKGYVYINKTREYLDYLEEHFNNVFSAFNLFNSKLNKLNDKGSVEEKDKYKVLLDFLSNEKQYESFVKEVINHDISKFSENEFVQYRKYFHPINNKEKKESEDLFEKAWEHHQKVNSHHWQNRVGGKYDSGEKITMVLHNVIDWVAMSYKFKEPIDKYYNKKKKELDMSDEDFILIELVFDLLKTD